MRTKQPLNKRPTSSLHHSEVVTACLDLRAPLLEVAFRQRRRRPHTLPQCGFMQLRNDASLNASRAEVELSLTVLQLAS